MLCLLIVLFSIHKQKHIFNLSSIKLEHTSGRSGRGTRLGGGAGSSRTGCQQNCSLMRQGSVLFSKASTKRRLNVFPEARTSEILCKSNAVTKFVESKTRTYHGRVGTERTAERRGEADQNWMPTEQSAQETSLLRTFQGIENISFERISRSTMKRNPM